MGISALRKLARSLLEPEVTVSKGHGSGPFQLELSERDPIELSVRSGESEELLRRLGRLGLDAAVERVTVRRHPPVEGDTEANASTEINLLKIRDPHWAVVSGGRRVTHEDPKLYCRMWCSDIPEDEWHEFGHSCTHGRGPHNILVHVEAASDRVWSWMHEEADQKAVRESRFPPMPEGDL